MNARPVVSVIVPSYRQGQYLKDSIGSLQAQTFTSWEAIIVNDGSPDETGDVAKALAENDRRVRYLETQHGGLSSARNAGLKYAKGEFVQFLDADDLLEPRKLEMQINILRNSPGLMVCYCDYWHGRSDDPRVRIDGQRVPCEFVTARPLHDLALLWETHLSIPLHSALFDSALFSKHCVRFDESLPNHEDWDIWMQVLAISEQVTFIPEELAIYRLSGTSMSRDKKSMWLGFSKAISLQTQRFSSDPTMCMLLGRKLAMMRLLYGHDPVNRFCQGVLTNRWLSMFVPVGLLRAMTAADNSRTHRILAVS